MIDDTRRFVYRDFGSWASKMLVVECPDGEPVTVLNARYTREQLLEELPHEDRHIEGNHFQDERPIMELEREAEEYAKQNRQKYTA